MKRFKHFMEDANIAISKLLLEQKKRKKKSDVEKRMPDAYQKNVRQKKIRKLATMDSYWRGLS